MNVGIVAAIVAVILGIVYKMISSIKAERALSRIRPEEAQKRAEEYAVELAKLTQEIKDADIRYDNARRNALNPSTGAGLPGSNRGSGSSDSEKK